MISLPILLPEGFSSLVVAGMDVTAGQVIAHKISPSEVTVNIAQGLNVPLKYVKKVLKKNPGDKVSQGDVIAEKRNLFGKKQAAIISEIEGIVTRYERDTGNLFVRIDQQTATNELISPVDGRVDLCNNKEIVIHTDKAVTSGRVVSGANSTGEVFVLEESFADRESSSMLFYLDSRAIGKVVLGGKFTREILIKGVSIGVAGFIGTDIREQDLEYMIQKKITVPAMEIDTEAMSQLIQWKGKDVRIDAQHKTVVLQKT